MVEDTRPQAKHYVGRLSGLVNSPLCNCTLHTALLCTVTVWQARSTGQKLSLLWQQRHQLGLSQLAYVHLSPVRCPCALYSLFADMLIIIVSTKKRSGSTLRSPYY